MGLVVENQNQRQHRALHRGERNASVAAQQLLKADLTGPVPGALAGGHVDKVGRSIGAAHHPSPQALPGGYGKGQAPDNSTGDEQAFFRPTLQRFGQDMGTSCLALHPRFKDPKGHG